LSFGQVSLSFQRITFRLTKINKWSINSKLSQVSVLTPIILATQEAEIRRIRSNSSRDPISKNSSQKQSWWSGSSSKSTWPAYQVWGPEFKSQFWLKKKIHNPPSSQEVETGESWVPGQPGIHGNTLSQKNK
jgi:hypothetical protein